MRGALRLGDGIDGLERLPAERDGAFGVADEARRLRRLLEHAGIVEGAVVVVRTRPQLERTLEVPERVAEGVRPGRGEPGADGRAQRAIDVAGRVPVTGELALAGGIARLPQRLRDAAMQRRALGGQQVRVDGLAHERVTEVQAVVVGHEHVRADGLAQRTQQLALIGPEDRGEQRVVGAAADDGQRSQRLLGDRRQRVDAHEQRVAQAVGQLVAGAGAMGREQLLGEERVALRAREDLVGERRAGRRVEDPGELAHQLRARQPSELDALHAPVARDLRELGLQRVAAMQFVRAVCRDDRHALVAGVRDDVAHEVERRGIGPVQVLDDEQHRRLLRQPAQQPEQQLEQPRLCVRAGVAGRRRGRRGVGELGHGARELRAGLRCELVEHACVRSGGELAQGGDDRGVRHVAAAETETRARQDEDAVRPRTARELLHEAALADAGLAADDRQARVAAGGAPHRRAQRGELGVAADERAAGDATLRRGRRRGRGELGGRRVGLGRERRDRDGACVRGRLRAARALLGAIRRRRDAQRACRVARQLAGAGVAVGRMLRQGTGEHGIDGVEPGDDLRQARRRLVQVRPHARGGRVALERNAPAEHPKQHAAERVDVGRRADGLAADLLGRRVVGAADPLVGAGRAVGRRRQPRQAEVRQECVIAGADEDVRGLDVAVHEADRVRRAERVGDLAEDRDRTIGLQALGRRAAGAGRAPRRSASR